MREKLAWSLVAALALAVVASFAGIVRGGPLDPPATPSSTMKTLDQVEPRTPIDSIPLTISNPGSYYLTQDLVSSDPNQDGITITSGGVTLDLNGFTLRGTALTGVGTGIWVNGSSNLRDIVIRNGAIRDWSTQGIRGTDLVHSSLHDLRIVENLGAGVTMGGGNTARQVIVEGNGFAGVFISSTNGVIGGLITDSEFSNNGGEGILSQVDRSVVRNSIVSSNAGRGIEMNAAYFQVVGNTVRANAGAAIFSGIKGIITGNYTTENAGGILQTSGGGARVGPQISDTSLTTDNPFANIVYDNPPPAP